MKYSEYSDIIRSVWAVLFLFKTILYALAAFILNILGISNASKDEPYFRKAMLWLVIGLLGSIATGMAKEGSALNLAANLVYSIGQIFVTFYVIDGVLAVIALIAMVIAYFMYLKLLSRANQMLA